MILDAATVQFCPRYPRGSVNEADLFYFTLFQAFKLLNNDFRAIKKTKHMLMQFLISKHLNIYTARQFITQIEYIIEMSFVTNKVDRLLCGIIETVEVEGVAYKIPIFAITKNSTLSKDGRPRMALTIYDDLAYMKMDETLVKNSFLYNITLYALRQKCISLDYVEYIFKSSGKIGDDRLLPAHSRVVITNPTYDYNLIKSYTTIYKKNLPNIHHCETCVNRITCWGATNAKNYKH